jgi:hypothetical protein
MRTWEELSEKEQLLTYISDVHKDAYGFRPRGTYNDWSVPELKKELDSLCEAANEEAKRIETMENESWVELKEHFTNLVNMGAKDFRQALEWDMQAEDCVHEGWKDYGFYCYSKRIAYRKERVLTRLAA